MYKRVSKISVPFKTPNGDDSGRKKVIIIDLEEKNYHVTNKGDISNKN